MNFRRNRSSFVKAALAAACAFGFAFPAFAQQTLITEPDQGFSSIYDLINSAQSTIDMTMYELQDSTAQNDLCNAAARGVTVRVVLDVNREQSNNTNAYNQLSNCGVQVNWAWTTYAATHQKSILVDYGTANAQVAIMSMNLTSRYYSTSRDYGVIENDANDMAAIETTFNADFAQTSVTPPTGDDLVWSPTNSRSSLLSIINNASTSLLVENEEMGDSGIVSALENAASRGVNVTIVLTDNSKYYSNLDALKSAGANIATYPNDNTSLYIHAKAIVADYGTPAALAFVGSENFSSYSLDKNRELGLTTTDSNVMSQLSSTMSNDYSNGNPY
jgi:phosphatidylserine/phosphatidylglycerophosphate/cardiolipin synthase-like enzyme